MADDDEPTPPGWYRQPDDPDTLRWWDGEDWTDDTMPVPGAAARARPEPHVEPEAEPHADAGADDGGGQAEPGIAAIAPAVEPPRAPVRGRGERGAVPLEAEAVPVTRAGPAPRPRVRPDVQRAPRAPGQRAPRPAGPSTAPRRAAPSAAPRDQRPRRPQEPTPRPRPAGERPPRHLDGDHRPARSGNRLVAKPAPAAIPTPVKVAVRAGLIAVLVALVWVGYRQLQSASSSDADTLSADPTPVTVADPSTPRLDQIVLRLSDLPRGWDAQATDPSSDEICVGRNPRSVIVPSAVQRAAFGRGDTGSFIGSDVQEFRDDDTARAFVDLTARVVDSCRESTAGGATFHFTPMEFPRFGDQTFVAEVSGESAGGEAHGALVYLRKGNRVASVVTITIGDTGVNTRLIEHLAEVVAHRMSSKPAIEATIDSGRGGSGGGTGGGATLPGEDG